jgi:hypothetical protein
VQSEEEASDHAADHHTEVAEPSVELQEQSIDTTSTPSSEPGSQLDLNAYDTYDYTQAEFDASTGLPPPDDIEAVQQDGGTDQVHGGEVAETTNTEVPGESST